MIEGTQAAWISFFTEMIRRAVLDLSAPAEIKSEIAKKRVCCDAASWLLSNEAYSLMALCQVPQTECREIKRRALTVVKQSIMIDLSESDDSFRVFLYPAEIIRNRQLLLPF